MNVERSAPRGAVFLSYASQDADAARRICDALRAAGIEVWFDQNELVGGDAWDQKIRKQIKECALLIPIISAATQARTEGYFRLEWRLADQRTHLMAKGRPFLLPVVIDATRDAEAHVPDSFTEVQWTRLTGGETSAAFCARVKKLLGGEVRAASAAIREPRDGRTAAEAAPTKRRLWLAPALLVVFAGAALVIWQPWHQAEKPAVVPPPVAASPGTAELARVRARIIPDRWQREDFAVVSATLDRLIDRYPEESDAYAMRSIINSLQVVRNFDAGTRPLEVGKSDADRALRLAPGSPLAEIAFGLHLVAMTSRGGDAAACRPYIDRGVAALPPDALTRYAELVSYWFGYEFEDVQRVAEAWLAAEPRASFPAWILSQSYFVQRQPDEAEKWAEQALVDSGITGVRAHYTRFESKYYLRADVRAAREALDKIPAAGRTVHRVVHARWLVAMVERRWDDALQELARVPEALLFDRSYHGPKALLAGLAHLRAGRTEAAAAQFREAERLLRELLAADPDNEGLHGVLAVALACGGHAAEARNELALFEPLVKRRPPTLQRGSLAVLIAHAYAILGDSPNLAFWLRRLLAEPSQFSFTPAAIRFDPRFAGATDAPEIQAVLKEFAALDQPVANAAAPKVNDKSVAVLAFANLSDDKSNEYFSDGISEELLNVLAKVPGLRVSARTSAFFFKGKQVPLAEIAQQLGIAYVVEGSVRKSGDRVRITAQLIKAADGFNVWSDKFDRDLKDIFAVQDEIAGLIAQNLQLKLGEAARVTRTVNPEAHQLYLRARAEWRLRTAEGYDRAEALLHQAIKLDPEFAPSYAWLTNIALVRDDAAADLDAQGKLSPWLATAQAYANRASELDPQSPEAHVALGGVFSMTRQWSDAEREFRQAIALNPNHATAHQWLARLLEVDGRMDEALATMRHATELDPLSSRIFDNFAMIFFHAGRTADALAAIERALLLQPDSRQARSFKAQYLISAGRHEEARPLASAILSGALTRATYEVADNQVCFVLAGVDDLAKVAAFYERIPSSAMVPKMIAAMQLGRSSEALAMLEPARIAYWSINVLIWSQTLDPIRDTPEFKVLLQKSNLAEPHRRAQAWRAAHPPAPPP